MSQIAQQPAKNAPRTDAPLLRAKNVRKSFRMGDSTVMVLKSVDISNRAGEFVAIEGRSGSGKSTLLHILGALDEADSGSVEYEQHDFVTMNESARSELRNKQFGFVFQFYHL